MQFLTNKMQDFLNFDLQYCVVVLTLNNLLKAS